MKISIQNLNMSKFYTYIHIFFKFIVNILLHLVSYSMPARTKTRHVSNCTGALISPYPDLLPDVFCLMVRIFRLMLVLLYM